MKTNDLDFTNQTIYVGIDVHKKSWTVTLRCNGIYLKSIRINPEPKTLIKLLKKNYPAAKYKSVYEAGFCGYWIDRELRASGIENIIVNPGDVPTTNKERKSKTDRIDSNKLSRELNNGTLEGIYVPSKEQESLRTLSRLRQQLTKDQARQKNRIKSLLAFLGINIPENCEMQHWSRKFIAHLSELQIKEKATKCSVEGSLNNLKELRRELAGIIKDLRTLVKEEPGISKTMGHLQSVPGVGFITTITLYTEIMDIKRFSSFDHLCSYVGLVPSTLSSGEKEKRQGMSKRQNKYLRNLLIESSWVAIRKDPALTMAFGKLCGRMSRQEAIIRIAKKLLNRIKYVWQEDKDYVCAVV